VTSLTAVDHVGESTATTIRNLRPTLVTDDTGEDDENEEAVGDDPSIAASGKS